VGALVNRESRRWLTNDISSGGLNQTKCKVIIIDRNSSRLFFGLASERKLVEISCDGFVDVVIGARKGEINVIYLLRVPRPCRLYPRGSPL